MRTGTRIALGSTVIVGVIACMAIMGGTSSWSYYVTVDECAERVDELTGARLRVSGTVGAGTLRVADDRSRAEFELIGQQGRIDVRCTNAIPESLEEGRQVVVEGTLENARDFYATRVMTRCASKYEASSRTSEAARQRLE